ncbi:uncharacterized protein LOC143239181 [Tachypleus tridentatus]|uniref:uncharacterized protein LOC143239181 n=1 Tax=Tachypleus tridentatus TaxID=6853 RepID=UPI003FD34F5F
MGCGGSSNVSGPDNPDDAPMDDKNVDSSNSESNKPVEITVESLEKYLSMEKQIQMYEKQHVLENYQVKTEQLEQLEKKLEELKDTQKQLNEQTTELQTVENADGTNDQNVKQFFMEKTENGQELSKEHEDIVDALNRKEIISQELESTTRQRDDLKQEIATLSEERETIQRLYEEIDEMLDNLFGGSYGSDLENQLEKEADFLQEQKHYMAQTHFKWRQAYMMVKQATTQLGLGVQKWKEIPNISQDDLEQKYTCAVESRNNIVAATQNLQGAHRYLCDVVFPYCTQEEVETLNKAITYIFTDMQTTDRHEHALSCYHTTYRRSGALRQWFEQVLNTVIARDVAQLAEEWKTKKFELRQERVRLIQERVKELTGKDVEFDVDVDIDAEDAAADEQVAQLFEAEKVKGQYNSLAPEPLIPPAPTPVPLKDLAPPPSNEEIFGKINELRKRHEAKVEDFKNSQALKHARMEIGLKEKLDARRSRRNRLQAHAEEMQALGAAV